MYAHYHPLAQDLALSAALLTILNEGPAASAHCRSPHMFLNIPAPLPHHFVVFLYTLYLVVVHAFHHKHFPTFPFSFLRFGFDFDTPLRRTAFDIVANRGACDHAVMVIALSLYRYETLISTSLNGYKGHPIIPARW